MKNRSFEIALIIGLIVFSLILYGAYLVYGLYMNSKSYTLFLKPYAILECKKWECKNISNKLNEYNNKSYQTFIDGKNIGINDIYYNNVSNKYYVFNKNNDSLYKEGSLFGYNGNATITSQSYKIEILDNNDINKLKQELNISFENDYAMYTGKVTLDFDNDGENETLYQMSSGLDAPSATLYFDYIIYEDNGKYTKLIETIYPETDFTKIGLTSISSIMDIFDDKKIEFIVSTEYPITGGKCSIIYRLKGKKYIPVNECEIVR